MVDVGQNRVYRIGELENLKSTSVSLIDTGIDCCKDWDDTIEQLKVLQAGAKVRSSLLASEVSGMAKMSKDEHGEVKDWTDLTLDDLISYMPDQDTAGEAALGLVTDITSMIPGMLDNLGSCIADAGSKRSLEEFQETLDDVKSQWDGKSIEENMEAFETILLGMPGNMNYVADPVNGSTGNFVYRYTDLKVSGNSPLAFVRTYNAMSRHKGILGRGWYHSYEKKIVEKDGRLLLFHEDGREEYFTETEGVYRSHSGIRIIKDEEGMYFLGDTEGNLEQYDREGNLILQAENGKEPIFFVYEDGRLSRVHTQKGESFWFTYDDKGQLTGVSDHVGRTVTFIYEGKKLTGAADPEGNAYTYAYGANGRISRMYDKRNVCIVENEYDVHKRIAAQRFPDGGIIRFEYQDKQNRVRMTEQNGSSVTYIHDSEFRDRKICREDGISEKRYDENGHVSRQTDKRGNETCFLHDKDGRLLKETDAFGNITKRTYDDDEHLLSVIHPDETEDVLGYDTYGRLSSVTDRAGETVRLSYPEEERRPHMITLADGSRMHLCYDARGNILSVDYPDGGCASYEYDELNRVTSNRDGNGNITRFTYDGMDRITGIQRADGAVQKIEYNPMGEAVRIEDYDGLSMKWEYNVLNKPSIYEDKQGRKTFMEYDLMWNMSRMTDPEGSVTEYAYDKQNRLESVTDPLGRRVSFTYDADGNRTSVCYPDGTKNCYEYDALNHIISETDRAGHVTRREYDCMGNLVSVIDNAGEKTCYAYDKCGRKLTETDRTGAVTRYTYTVLGKKESVTHPGGRVERWQYGPGGRLDRYKKGDGTWEEYGYDRNGNLVRKRYQDGNEHTYLYDCLNRMTDILLNGKKEKSYTYDAMGNVTSMEDASGRVTRYAYSPSGKLLSVTDALGNKVFYAYNGRDELTGILQLAEGEDLAFLTENEEDKTVLHDKEWQEIMEHNRESRDLHLTLFTRDKAGQAVKVTDALGREDCYEYDIMGRVKKRTDQEGKETAWEYHPDGQVKSILYPDGKKASYGYDALARLQEVRDWLGDTAFAYDAEGRLTKSTDHKGNAITYGWNPDGTKKNMVYPDGRQVSYAYDTAGHVSRIESGDFSLDYEYDAYGRLEECHRDNGILTKYQYDALGRLCGLSHEDKDGILEAFRCTYDENGNKGSVERTSRDSAYSFCYIYTYDGLDRLTAVYDGKTLLKEYFYDGYGNRMEAGQICSYDVMNRLTAAENREYSYSPKGELTAVQDKDTPEKSRAFAYDSNGFMTSLYGNGQLLQENFHNGLGCRMGSSLYAENLSEVSYGIDYADPFKRILTESHADGIKRNYLWQDDTLLGIPQDGVHVLTDLFHTPVRTAGKDGSSDSVYRYDEDGMLCQSDGIYALPFGYTGYLKESMDGLYYTGSREYSSIDGRFHSKDQYRYMDYKNLATLNLYAYAWNNPLRYFDFDGHESIGEKSYLERSLEMVVLGNFSEESTLLGLAGGIVLSAFGGDIVMDVRDLVADLTVNADPTSLAWWGTIVLDIAAFVPLVGVVKYFDDVVDVFKKAFKVVDGEIDDILKVSRKYLSSAKSGLESLTKKLGDIGKNIRNSAKDGWNRLMKVFKKGDINAKDVKSIGKKLETKGISVRNNLDNFIVNYKQSDEYINLTNAQRKKIDRKLYGLQKGNIAVADVDIPGIKTEFKAHSQIHSKDVLGSGVDEFSYAPIPEERNFETYVEDVFPRYNDTEAKILEDIASQIEDSNIKGTINLYSELDCCQSCTNIILEFRRKYPNIKLNIYTNSTIN